MNYTYDKRADVRDSLGRTIVTNILCAWLPVALRWRKVPVYRCKQCRCCQLPLLLLEAVCATAWSHLFIYYVTSTLQTALCKCDEMHMCARVMIYACFTCFFLMCDRQFCCCCSSYVTGHCVCKLYTHLCHQIVIFEMIDISFSFFDI